MSTIYIHTGQGDGVPHEEENALALWRQGQIPGDALYWKEGMTDWQPLADYFPSASSEETSVPPPLAGALPSARQFTRDPSNLTTALKTLLWVYLGMAVLGGIGEGINIAMGGTDPQSEELPPHQLGIACVALLHLVVIIPTGVIFLMWIYRANLNARGFGASDMKFTPGWSVGWYFIPILNLFRPYQAMKEIWQASRNPQDWQSQPVADVVNWWWGLWVLSNMVNNVSMKLTWNADTAAEDRVASMLNLTCNVLDIPLCIVSVMLVSGIYRMQKAYVEQSA